MSEQVELSVRSQLRKVIEDLEAIASANKVVQESFKASGEEIGESFNRNVKRTSVYLEQMRSLGSRVLTQMKGDFKALLSLNAIQGALKLSSQFHGSIREALSLSDTIRKLGTTFGMSQGEFAGFQKAMVKGLGEVGLSSDVATAALGGLAQTQVRGQTNLVGYSRTAGQLASITRERGQEGGIARGMSEAVREQGGNVNDLAQMRGVAQDLLKVYNATGKGPTETLSEMNALLKNMPKDLRRKMGTGALANMSIASAVAGPDATKFLEEYLGKSKIGRMPFEAQGGGNLVSDKGLDLDKFAKFAKNITSRIGMDPRAAAQTLGLSEEAAEGFIRLADSLKAVRSAQDMSAKSQANIGKQYQSSMGFQEAFQSNLNRIKDAFAGPLAAATQGGTDFLSSASQSDTGAVGVAAGGGLLAALMAGVGMRGVGGAMGMDVLGMAKGKAVSQLSGGEIQQVYVVNANEIGSGGVGGAAGGIGKLGTGALAVGAAAAGVGAGMAVNAGIEKVSAGTETDAKLTEMVGYLAQMVGLLPKIAERRSKDPVIKIDNHAKDIKASNIRFQGASN